MNFKPDIVAQPLVVEQVKGLIEQKHKLSVQVEQLEHRLKLIESSLSENDQMSERVKVLVAESLSLFEEEWKRKSEFYPDLWLASLEQALVQVAAPAKKK
jgi:hypothetical protein